MNAQASIDTLIDWYEANGRGGKVIHTAVTRATLIAFAGNPADGRAIIYRGYELVPSSKITPTKT